MRILQVHTRYRYAGGEDTVVDAEAQLLRGAGHDVEQLLARNPHETVAALGALVVAPWNARAAGAVRTGAARFRPDVAHVHNTWFAQSPAVITALHRLGVPVVMTLHNYRLLCSNAMLLRDGSPCELCVGSHPWHAVRFGCYRGSRASSIVTAGTIALHRRLGTWTEQVHTFLATSEFVRDRHIAAGFPAERIVVKRNVTTDPGPRPRPPSASSTVLFVGRLSQEKGLPFLLDVWRRHAPPGLQLEIIGAGPLAETLDVEPGSRVRVAGARSAGEVRERMLAARALLLPSLWYEGQPMVALEALAAGLPLVASRLGALVETAAPLGESWLAAPGDEQEWGAALRALADDGHVDRAGEAARSAYEAAHTPERGLRRLEAAYDATGRAR